jgi:hypothetical protein
MSNQHAQIKMFETIGVLIVFLILLAFGLIFYNAIQEGSVKDQLREQREGQALTIIEKSLLLPEIDCSTVLFTDLYCIDILKLESFIEVLEEGNIAVQAEYFTVFKNSEVLVKEVWPNTGANPIIIYSNIPDEFVSKNSFTTPILLKNPLQKEDVFGILEVNTYESS